MKIDELDPNRKQSPKEQYDRQCRRTRGRIDANGQPIEMRLTFEEWCSIWANSGHWHERGNKSGQYVMSRKNDIGHYEVGNVEIVTCNFNNATKPSLAKQRGRNNWKAALTIRSRRAIKEGRASPCLW